MAGLVQTAIVLVAASKGLGKSEGILSSKNAVEALNVRQECALSLSISLTEVDVPREQYDVHSWTRSCQVFSCMLVRQLDCRKSGLYTVSIQNKQV